MYKAAVRWMIRRNIEALNRGDYGPALAMFDDEATLTLPRGPAPSRPSSVTRGRAAPPTPPTGAGPRSSGSSSGTSRPASRWRSRTSWSTARRGRLGPWSGPMVVTRARRRGPLREPGRAGRADDVGQDRRAGGLRGHRAGRGVPPPAHRGRDPVPDLRLTIRPQPVPVVRRVWRAGGTGCGSGWFFPLAWRLGVARWTGCGSG